jgi:hypothetical protein
MTSISRSNSAWRTDIGSFALVNQAMIFDSPCSTLEGQNHSQGKDSQAEQGHRPIEGQAQTSQLSGGQSGQQ